MTTHVPFHPPFVVRRKNRGQVDIAEWITGSTFSAGVDQVTEIETVIADPALQRIGAAGIFVVGDTHVTWAEIHEMVLSAVEVSGGEAGTGQARLQWRPLLVRNLKRARGPHVLRGVSASQYVVAATKAAGGQAIAQETARRTQIARDVPKDAEPPPEGANYPSDWTTFQRLAREEGFIIFEYAGIVYFGRPSWVRTRRMERNVVRWYGGTEENQSIGFPTVRKSEDSETLVTIEARIPYRRVNEFRPGWSFDLEGIPYFSGGYMVGQLRRELSAHGIIEITAMSALDPLPTEVQGSETTERGIGPHKELVDAAIKAGFTGEALLTAVAVALAESGGNRQAVSPQGAGGVRHWGLWQINDRDHTFDKTLIFDALYNAKFAFTISKGGRDWTPWTTYRNNAYKTHLETARSSIEVSQSIAPAISGASPGVPNPAAEAELSTRATRVRRAVVAQFGEMTIHGWGTRPNATEHDDRDPRTGRRAANALDFMTGQDMRKGQAITDFLAERQADLEIDYIIWNRQINSFDGRGWRRYTGANPHLDHPHVTVER